MLIDQGFQLPGNFRQGQIPGNPLRHTISLSEGPRQPPIIERAVSIAAFITHPPCIDFGTISWFQPDDASSLGMMPAFLAVVGNHMASTTAPGTDGISMLKIPDPYLEAKITIGQGPDRTDIRQVPGVLVV